MCFNNCLRVGGTVCVTVVGVLVYLTKMLLACSSTLQRYCWRARLPDKDAVGVIVYLTKMLLACSDYLTKMLLACSGYLTKMLLACSDYLTKMLLACSD